MSHLTKQVVLITGCSSGIGRALCLELAAHGHRVFATARDPDSLVDLQRCEPVQLDVTDSASIDDAVARVLNVAGRIDLLINNAGINRFGPLVELSAREMSDVFETNVLGQVAMARAVFPAMTEQGSGRIVNFGSVVGDFPTPWGAAYCGSKSAVHTLSEMLRIEVAPFGIDVVVVAPGRIKSAIADNSSRNLDRFAGPPSKYAFAHEQIVARAHLSQDQPMETVEFARIVAERITRQRAPRIVRVGPGAKWLTWMKRLPAPMLDRMLARRFGLAGKIEASVAGEEASAS